MTPIVLVLALASLLFFIAALVLKLWKDDDAWGWFLACSCGALFFCLMAAAPHSS